MSLRVEVRGLVWLDTEGLRPHQVRNLKDRLTIYPRKTSDHPKAETPRPIFLYEEDEARGLLGIPRQFYLRNRTKDNDEEVLVANGAPLPELETRWIPDPPYEEQAEAVDLIVDKLSSEPYGGAMIRAGCAWGKTYTAIEIARRLGRRTGILVHKEFLAVQWEDSIRSSLPGATIGRVQQKRCEIDCDFVVIMLDSMVVHLKSLSERISSKYPIELQNVFGTLIGDEVHRVGANSWSQVVPYFSARHRLGLTATPRRKDGAEGAFLEHVSDITFDATVDALVPGLRVLTTDTELYPVRGYSHREGRVKMLSVRGMTSQQITSQLVDDPIRTSAIVGQLVKAVEAGRKSLVIAERLSVLRDIELRLREQLVSRGITPSIAAYTGEWFTGEMKPKKPGSRSKPKPKMRKVTADDWYMAERAQVILCTKQLVEEGLNIPAVDTGFLVTPMSDVEQAVGRIRRHCLPEDSKCSHYCSWRAGSCTGKPSPVWVDVVDAKVERAASKYRRRQGFYRSVGMI